MSMNIESYESKKKYDFPNLRIVDPEPVFSESQHVGIECGQVCVLFEAHKSDSERKAFMEYLEFSTELM